MNSQKDNNLFERLVSEETKFFGTEFLSPVFGGPIIVKISDIVVKMKVAPHTFQGWGVFSTSDGKVANLVREATDREKQNYLKLFPQVSFIICNVDGNTAYGLGINNPQFTFTGLVPVLLSANLELFDVVYARFNGKQVWFESINRRYPRKISSDLRKCLTDEIDTDKLDIKGISRVEREAYNFAYSRIKPSDEKRIEDAITRGGAKFLSYKEDRDGFVVTYNVDGKRHTSRVSKDLMVQSAGICLTDHRTNRRYDTDFDLQTLIGVIREGYDTRQIVRWGI